MIKEPDSRLKVLPQDLEDKANDLYRLNQVINDLYTKIDTLRIDGKFYGKSQFERIWLDTSRDPNILADKEVINLGEIRRLGLTGSGTTTRIISGGGGGGGGGVGGSITVQYPPATPYLDAVSRSLSEKVGETISVLDFGALGDGVTDDSSAFNKAVAAAIRSGRGKRILIPACKTGSYYKLDSKISISNLYYLNGIVSTSGTTVTLESGDTFPTYLDTGYTITIDGSDYTVSSRTSDTVLELTTTPVGDPLASVGYLAAGNTYVPIQFDGEGDLSIVQRGDTLGAGEGLFDVRGVDVTFSNFCVDGGVTSPTGLQYSAFSSDPMNALLTADTSFWIHGPSKNVTFSQMTVQHTGGYSILLDATNGSNAYDSGVYDIHDTKIVHSKFINNRPHLFGNGGAEEYGSWTGGIFLNTYGIQDAANYLSTVYNTLVEGCYFMGNTGNCVWSHLYGFDILFSDLRAIGNTFIDNGLDGILFGGIAGGSAIGNRFRRTGYIATDTTQDVSVDNPTTPKWLSGLNATALDTSGIAKNVVYANNTFISTNGGDMDLDGMCDSQVIGNSCITPRSYDPEYTEDSIALTGPPGYPGKYSYGCQPSNSYGGQWGGVNVSITGNSFINKDGGAIRLAATRGGYISGNNINHPDAASYPPIILFNIDTGSEKRTYNTVVSGNTISYNPASAVAAIQEWGAALGYPAFQAGDKNWIHDNQLIGTYVYEFYKDADTDSSTEIKVSMSHSALASGSDTVIDRLRSVVTGGNFDYLKFSYNAGTKTQAAYLLDHAILGVGGYVNRTGTSVSWVSGDKFTSFANGDSIVIAGVTYTISTVNSDISITLTSGAGSSTASVFTNPVYKWGAPSLNVGDGTNGSITTGNRSIIGFDDVMATNVFAGDGFLSLTDSLINDEKANKLPDTYGLMKYDSVAKVFKISTSATLGVRDWTTLGSGGGSPGGLNTYVQFNDSSTFGGVSSFTFDKTSKLLSILTTAGNPSIVTTGYIQSNGGFLSQADAYNAFQGSFGDGAALYGAEVSQYTLSGTVDTSGTAVTRVSGSVFEAAMAGQAVTINSVAYTVATYVDGNNITLTATAGTQTGVSYSSQAANRGGYYKLSPQATGSFPIALTGTSFGSNDVLLWVASTNGTVSPVTSYGLVTNSYIDAAVGFATLNTTTDAIQAPAGGVTSKYLIGTTSLTITGDTAAHAGLSTSSAPGSGRIYFDSTSRRFLVSENGGAYVNLIGSSPAGSTGYLQYNVSGSLGANSNFYYDIAKGFVSIGGETTSANITARLYVRGAGHFWSDTTNDIIVLSKAVLGQTGNHFEAQTSGGSAFWAISSDGGMYFRNNGTPSGIASTGLIYFDGTKLKAREGTAAAVDLLSTTTPAGSSGYIQYNVSGSLSASVNLFYDTTNNYLSLGGTTSGLTARLYVRGAGHFWADSASQTIVLSKGTTSQSGNHFEAQTNAGTAFWAVAPDGGTYFRNNGTPTGSAGLGILYFDGSAFKYWEGTSGPFSLSGSGVTSLNTRTGALSVTGGTSITVTSPTSSTIQVAAAQDIATTASPAFVGLTLNNASGVSMKNLSGTSRLVLSLASTNDLYLDNVSDGNIYIRPITGGSVIIGRDPTVTSSALPNGDNKVALGSSSFGWSSVYARSYFYWNGSSYVAGTFGGVTSVSAGTGISVSGTTAVTVTNTGVTSLSAGTGVSLTGSTGAITASIGQSVATSASPTFVSMALACDSAGTYTTGLYIKNTVGTTYLRMLVANDNNLYIDNQDSGAGDIYIRPYSSGAGLGRYVVIGKINAGGGVLPYGNNMTLGNSGNAWSTVYATTYCTPTGTGYTGTATAGSFTTITIKGGIITNVT